MSKSLKIEKEFKLTDSTVNCYGFRLLTSGYQQDLYAKNPIGYYMHERDGGVVLKWEDFRSDGESIWAKPVINMSNKRGQQTADEVESGFLNAASVGHLVVLETSTDPALMLPDQKGPTVTKWYNRECSLVDIPGNFNSLSLFDKDENPLNLADFSTTKKIYVMEKLVLTAANLTALNLKAEADQTAVNTAIADLVAKANKVDTLEADAVKLTADKKVAEDALTELKKTTVTKEVDTILEDALAAKKITKEVQTKLKTTFADKPTELKDLIDAMPAYKSITGGLNDGGDDKDKVKNLAAMSWDDLHKAGKLADLKATDFEAFKTKYKAEFNKEYKEDNA